jgi:hypothetical protein
MHEGLKGVLRVMMRREGQGLQAQEGLRQFRLRVPLRLGNWISAAGP